MKKYVLELSIFVQSLNPQNGSVKKISQIGLQTLE